MSALLAVFWAVVTFSILVILHEGGHFVAARLFGIKVHEFMVGLPGPAIRFHGRTTTYGITAVPLGGYVRIAGMEPGKEDELLGPALGAVTRAGRMTSDELAGALGIDMDRADSLMVTLVDWDALTQEGTDDDEIFVSRFEPADGSDIIALIDRARSTTYRGVSTWKRIVVLSAGVLVNLLTAIIVFTVVLSIWGFYQPSMTTAGVMPETAAAEAGLLAGDRITAVDGKPMDDWLEFTQALATYDIGDDVRIGFQRQGAPMDASATLGASPEGEPFLGVQVEVEHVNFTPFQAARESVTWIGLVFVAIAGFFQPETFQQSVEGARSIVGIAEVVAEAASNGPLDYAWIVALLSLSLGAMNILPIPPLDGGKIALELIERVIGRPIERRLSLGISVAGALLLFTFIGYLMYADIMRMVTRG